MNTMPQNWLMAFLLAGLIVLSASQGRLFVSVHEYASGRTLLGNWTKNTEKQSQQAVLAVYDYDHEHENQRMQAALISFISTSSGLVQARVVKPDQGSDRINVYLQLTTGEHLDGKAIQLAFSVQRGFNKSANEWKTPKISTVAYLYENMQSIVNVDIGLNFHMRLGKNKQVLISLLSQSLRLDLALAQAKLENSCSVVFAAINAAQIILLILYDRNKSQAHLTTLANTSEWLIVQTIAFTLVQLVLLTKLFFAYYDTEMYYICLNALMTLVVALLMLKAYQIVLEKFRNKIKAGLLLLSLAVYFYLAFQFYQASYFWIVECCLLLLLQIVYSVQQGGDGAVSLFTLLVVLAGRLPLVLLFYLDQNYLRVRPDRNAAILMATCLGLHSLTIMLQKKFGNRFFTPVMIMPDYFQYERKTFYNTPEADKQCGVCFNKIKAKPEESPQQTKAYEEKAKGEPELMLREIVYVSTPCQHVFHRQCLSEWMQKSLTCPMDRTSLPRMNV